MTANSTALDTQARPLGRSVAFSLVGALGIAAAAQVAIPVPGTPVPMTLQPLAVLVVGGILGPRYGALSALLYLAMGVAGLPVFTPGGLPGFSRLLGPTGGYLISYPFAAFAVGALRGHSLARAWLAAAAGLAIILIAGTAQLAILSGTRVALTLGFLPFVIKDLGSVLVAGLLVHRFKR